MVADRMMGRIRRRGANLAIRTGTSGSWGVKRSQVYRQPLDDEGALALAAFYRGVSLIASAIGGLPIHVLKKLPNGDRVDAEDATNAYLWARPNPEMTRVSLWERAAGDEIRGNAFLFVIPDRFGGPDPESIWYMERQRFKVGRTTEDVPGVPRGTKVYEVDGETPMIDYAAGGEIIHIPNWGGALLGYDLLKLASTAIQLGLSAEEYAARNFTHGQVPPGLITSDQELSPSQANRIARRWRQLHQGLAFQHDIAVLGSGAKFQQTSVDLDKMQMEGLRKFQVQEIGRFLGLPPHMLGDVSGSTSWGTGIAEQGQGFVTYTLNAHITRFKQAIDDALLVRELTGKYVEFDAGGLLRGNIKDQYEAHDKGIKGSFIVPNEARVDLNLDKHPDGDDLLIPVNLAGKVDRELRQMKVRADAAGNLVRSGYDPADVLEKVGLPPIKHTGKLPVTVQPDDEPEPQAPPRDDEA